MQYVLDRLGMLTVLPGIRGMDDLKEILKYIEATAEEKDYSIIGEFAPVNGTGKCGHCNKRCQFKVDQ